MRRPLVRAILIVVLAVLGVSAVLAVLIKQEPDFYAAASAETDEDEVVASDVLTRLGDLTQDIRSKSDWRGSFTPEELNAFFRQNMTDGEWLAGLVPAGFHSPRVAIDGDRVKIAGRYGEGATGTVLTLDLKAWLVQDELNTVAVELVGMRAGALPVELQWFISLDTISERVRGWNAEVTWYRHDGHLVGLFRFYADQTQPATQIRTVTVGDGRITVGGRSRLEAMIPAGPAVVAPEGQ